MSLVKNILDDFEKLSIRHKESIEYAFGIVKKSNLKNFKHSQKEFLNQVIKWLLSKKTG